MNVLKVCKIHGDLLVDQVIEDAGYYRCKKCKNEKDLRYREKNRKKLAKKTAHWRLRNPSTYEERKAYYEMDRARNPEKYKAAYKKQRLSPPDFWTDEMIIKSCDIHGELKPSQVYYRNQNNIRCKKCSYEISKKYRQENKGSINEKIRIKRKENLEYADKIRKRDREYQNSKYHEKREEILRKRREFNEKNPEVVRSTNLRKMYKMTIDEYEKMVKDQDNKCKICRMPETAIHQKTKEIKRLSVDHCHATKKVRGLLCTRCNCMIGYARNSKELLNSGIDYLNEAENGSS